MLAAFWIGPTCDSPKNPCLLPARPDKNDYPSLALTKVATAQVEAIEFPL